MLTIQKKVTDIDENYDSGALALFDGNLGIEGGTIQIDLTGIAGTADGVIKVYVSNDIDAVKGWALMVTENITATPFQMITNIYLPYKYIKYTITLNSITNIDTLELWGSFIQEQKGV
jgi:hypothetical protein